MRSRAEAAAALAHEEDRHQRCTGQIRQHRRGPHEVRLAAEHGHRHAVARDMPIHQHRDGPALRQATTNLQRGVERLPHFDGVGVERRAHAVSQPVDRGIGLRHGDHGERYAQGLHQHRASFPVAEVARHQNRAPAERERVLQVMSLLVDEAFEDLLARPRQRSHEVHPVVRVRVTRAVGTPPQLVVGLLREDRAQVVDQRIPHTRHRVADEPGARMGHRPRQRQRGVPRSQITATDDEGSVETVGDPAHRRGEAHAGPRPPRRKNR